jgi:hypothetical protein
MAQGWRKWFGGPPKEDLPAQAGAGAAPVAFKDFEIPGIRLVAKLDSSKKNQRERHALSARVLAYRDPLGSHEKWPSTDLGARFW